MNRSISLAAILIALAASSAPLLAAQAPRLDPYSLAVVKRACGPENSFPSLAGQRSGPAPPLADGRARIYVFAPNLGFIRPHLRSVPLGVDGRWFGANVSGSYSFVDVAPGVHHVCASSAGDHVLPGTTAAVALARVDAKAGNTYYLSNSRGKDTHIFSLTPIDADAAAMYMQTLPSTQFGADVKLPKPWKIMPDAVQSACGPNPSQLDPAPVPTPSLLAGPAPGKALLYLFVPTKILFSRDPLVHVGMDGRWIGSSWGGSFLAVEIEPGTHHLCSAARLYGVGPVSYWVRGLRAVAGETYYANAVSLQPVDADMAAFWLGKIADQSTRKISSTNILDRWGRKEMPYLNSKLRECGVPTSDAMPTTLVSPSGADHGAPSDPQVFFLLISDFRRLRGRNAVNAGVDGKWAASLRETSWVSLPEAVGPHHTCIQIAGFRRGNFMLPGTWSTPFFSSFDAVPGARVYFEGNFVGLGDTSGDGETLFFTRRLDPDEGALLTAIYPRAAVSGP